MNERQRLALLISPIAAVTAAQFVGDALSPTLLVSAPLVLVALVPKNRVFVLTAPLVDFTPFLVVGLVRLLLTDPLFFILGRLHGRRALRWLEQRSASPHFVQRAERWFRRASYPIVAFSPSSIICALAGATGMPAVPFFITNVAGTIARMTLIWWIGDVFSEPLLEVVDFVRDYSVWLTGLTLVIVVFAFRRGRKRGTTLVESVDEAAKELHIADGDPTKGDDPRV